MRGDLLTVAVRWQDTYHPTGDTKVEHEPLEYMLAVLRMIYFQYLIRYLLTYDRPAASGLVDIYLCTFVLCPQRSLQVDIQRTCLLSLGKNDGPLSMFVVMPRGV